MLKIVFTKIVGPVQVYPVKLVLPSRVQVVPKITHVVLVDLHVRVVSILLNELLLFLSCNELPLFLSRSRS